MGLDCQRPAQSRPLILFYNNFFDSPPDLSDVEPEHRSCFVLDRAFYAKADAVIFHIPDLHWSKPTFKDVAQLQKRPQQLWIAWSLESAMNYPIQLNPTFMGRFDFVMGYRRSADIWTPYCPRRATWIEALRVPVPMKSETAPLVMFQSAPVNKSRRVEYALELMASIRLDSYGGVLNNKELAVRDAGRATKLATIARYKFCLSLENTIEQDYVTEKFFDPLLVGTVPVYRGARNVGDLAPGEHCFIDAHAFASPKELAQYLNHLATDREAYERYFQWRERPFLPAFQRILDAQAVNTYVQILNLVRLAKRGTWDSESPRSSSRR